MTVCGFRPSCRCGLRATAAAAAACLMLAGCSTPVLFTSDIEGATVTAATGESYGMTPTQVSFDNDALADSVDITDGCARITGVTYKWPSGATVSSPNPIRLCGEAGRYVFKLERPKDAPGVETDLKFAIERMRLRQAELQADLERERLYSDHFFMMGPIFYHRPPPPRHRPPPRRR